ncbi:hypothetical protein HDV05_001813 [Chytridiales sp. JEL 0842]|nr:hypothetical protein HDV05_001813 [Chytridiales sp. JEL 0842]
MQLINIFSTLLIAAFALTATAAPLAVQDQQALEKRNLACIKYNTQDCRRFELYEIDSRDVTAHMIPGSPSNVPSEVPEAFHGIFYMMGNPLPDELVSLANGKWDSNDNTYNLRVYEENMWSWTNSLAGRLLYESVRTFALTYKMRFQVDKNTGAASASVEPVFYTPTWLGNDRVPIADIFANFTVLPTENPNIYIRRTTFLTVPATDYQFVKIFNGDGTPTPEYERTYLPRIGAGEAAFPASTGFSNATHLEATMLLAREKKGWF